MTLAKQSGQIKGQVPLPFQLTYDPAHLKPGHTYAVSARIEEDGKLLFITQQRNTVELNGKDPQPLRIRVDQVR